MQYALAALLALAGAALAQVDGFDAITSPPEGSTLKAGDTFAIVWEPAPAELDEELVDIILLAGSSPSTLDAVEPAIAEGVTNKAGTFEWEIPADLGDKATYGIKIQLQSDPKTFQFSFPFEITPSKDGGVKSNSTMTAKPTKTSSADDEEETDSSSVSKPKTTLYTTVDDSAATPAPSTKTSPGAGAQATAGAFAVLGGLAIAALAL
jgi:hypothetical protein